MGDGMATRLTILLHCYGSRKVRETGSPLGVPLILSGKERKPWQTFNTTYFHTSLAVSMALLDTTRITIAPSTWLPLPTMAPSTKFIGIEPLLPLLRSGSRNSTGLPA